MTSRFIIIGELRFEFVQQRRAIAFRPSAVSPRSEEPIALAAQLLRRLFEVSPAPVRRLARDADLGCDLCPRLVEGASLEDALIQDLLGELQHLRRGADCIEPVLRLLLNLEPPADAFRRSATAAARIRRKVKTA